MARYWCMACIAVLLSVVRTFSLVNYPLHWLNPYDESFYVNSGRMLAAGEMARFNSSPLSSFFYLPLYLHYRSDPWWLSAAATFGHRLLFLGLWYVAAVLAWRVRHQASPWATLVWPLLIPAFFGLVANSSDALFAILNGASLASMFAFVQTRSNRHLVSAASLVGIAPLARADGLPLLVTFIAFSVVLLRSHGCAFWATARMATILLLICLTPSFLYLVAQGQSQWNTMSPGLAERTYVAFRQGQGYVYAERYPPGVNPAYGGALEADRLYGTAGENGNSVLSAIRHNPRAYAARCLHALSNLPGQARAALGWPILVAAAIGIAALWRKGEGRTLFVCLGWMLFLGAYFVTFFRPGYFLLAFFPLSVLAAAGLYAMAQIGGSCLARGSVLRVGRSLTAKVPRSITPVATTAFAVLLLFAASSIGRSREYHDPDGYEIDREALETQVALLSSVRPGESVAALAPQSVYNARLPHRDFSFEPSSESIEQWLAGSDIDYVLVDPAAQREDPERQAALIAYATANLELLYSHDGLYLFRVPRKDEAK